MAFSKEQLELEVSAQLSQHLVRDDHSGWTVVGSTVAVYLFGLGASSVALWAALELFGHPAGRAELVLALAAGVFATVLRYLMLNRWVFVEPARG